MYFFEHLNLEITKYLFQIKILIINPPQYQKGHSNIIFFLFLRRPTMFILINSGPLIFREVASLAIVKLITLQSLVKEVHSLLNELLN